MRERADDVVRLDGGRLAQVLDAHGALVRREQREQRARPVAAVRHEAEVGEGPLRRAHLVLLLGQLVGEGDKELAVPLALVGRQREDARQVVPLLAVLLLAEVAHDVAPALIRLREHVEQEQVHVVVQRLVVQEQLGQEAQVLAVHLLLAAVNLEHRHAVVPVNLVARRVQQLVLAQVPPQLLAALEECQRELGSAGKRLRQRTRARLQRCASARRGAHLAEEELGAVVVLGREGREVPGVHLVPPELDLQDVAHFRELLVLAQRRGVKLRVLLRGCRREEEEEQAACGASANTHSKRVRYAGAAEATSCTPEPFMCATLRAMLRCAPRRRKADASAAHGGGGWEQRTQRRRSGRAAR